MKKLFLILFLCFSVSVYGDAYIEDVPVVDQDIFEDVFSMTGICGPTVFAEVVAFWGINGYPNLLQGPLSGQVPDVSQGMQNIFMDAVSYCGYTTSGTHPNTMASGLENYFADCGYDVEIVHFAKGRATAAQIMAELDAGRPIALLVWNWNHWIMLNGYTSVPLTMTVLYGHIQLERVLSGYSLPYLSQMEAIFVRPIGEIEPEPDPTIESWWPEVSEWLENHGWEMEIID